MLGSIDLQQPLCVPVGRPCWGGRLPNIPRGEDAIFLSVFFFFGGGWKHLSARATPRPYVILAPAKWIKPSLNMHPIVNHLHVGRIRSQFVKWLKIHPSIKIALFRAPPLVRVARRCRRSRTCVSESINLPRRYLGARSANNKSICPSHLSVGRGLVQPGMLDSGQQCNQ